MALGLIAASVVVLGSWLVSQFAGTTRFVPGACERVEDFLTSHIVGQELAVGQIVDAVCAHIDSKRANKRIKPLVLSIHGPPGVGKTFTHTLLARALYNKDPASAIACPGTACMGAKVVYGLDFPAAQRAAQLEAVRAAILEHVAWAHDPLVVIEEYDKLDCAARAMLRELLEHALDAAPGGGLSRAIILLESNLGFPELEQILTDNGGDRAKVTPESVERTLRDAVFAAWRKSASQPAAAHSAGGSGAGDVSVVQDGSGEVVRGSQGTLSPDELEAATRTGGGSAVGGCEESWVNTLRTTSAVDFFVGYLPLQGHHVRELLRRELASWGAMLLHDKGVALEWEEQVEDWLSSKVDFDGPYPLEGAKQVASVVTRHIARAVRKCPNAKVQRSAPGAGQASGPGEGSRQQQGTTAAGPVMRLVVREGRALVVMYPEMAS